VLPSGDASPANAGLLVSVRLLHRRNRLDDGCRLKPPLNRAAERWVEETKKKLTLNEKIGQLIVPAFESGFLSTDSDLFDEVSRLVREYHVGGFHVFGASVPAPAVLLNSSWCPL
jgi:hypothetical protein